MNQYAYSNDGEMFHGSFDTPEDAAVEGFCSGDEDIVYVGEVVSFTAHDFVNAGSIIDNMQEQAWDDCGEYTADWLSGLGKVKHAELESEMTKAIGDIIEKYDSPSFFGIKNVQEWPRADAISSGVYDPNA